MNRRPTIAALVFVLVASGMSHAEEEAPALRFDPFVRPTLAPVDSSEGSASHPEWSPVLRSTLVAGTDSLANLGGVVLRIGQETHGYRLLGVERFGATFERDGVEVELRLHRADEERP